MRKTNIFKNNFTLKNVAYGDDIERVVDTTSILFFRRFWRIVKEDAFKLTKEVYIGSAQLNRLNYATIVLNPKKHNTNNRRLLTYFVSQ